MQGNYALAEELVFRKLSREFSAEIQREVRILGQGSYILDGIVLNKGAVTAIEVKLVRYSLNRQSLESTLYRITEFVRRMPEMEREKFRLILALVLTESATNLGSIRKQVEQSIFTSAFPVELRFYELSQLESEFANELPVVEN
jgi:hypothetical protein